MNNARSLLFLMASLPVLQTGAVGQQTPAPRTAAADGLDQYRAMLNTYCVTCHNTRTKIGGIAFDGLDLQNAAGDAQIWEKALRKLRGHLMSPSGAPQPPQKDVDAFDQQVKLMFDLLALADQADLTRVASYDSAAEGWGTTRQVRRQHWNDCARVVRMLKERRKIEGR
jgi:mono/diheme cytochrome c family protein